MGLLLLKPKPALSTLAKSLLRKITFIKQLLCFCLPHQKGMELSHMRHGLLLSYALFCSVTSITNFHWQNCTIFISSSGMHHHPEQMNRSSSRPIVPFP